jgi:hypothetical protein
MHDHLKLVIAWLRDGRGRASNQGVLTDFTEFPKSFTEKVLLCAALANDSTN